MQSIATKTGDDGTTSLLFGRLVAKTDVRIAANGRIDELNVRLGMAKACLPPEETEARAFIEQVQRNLVNLMGEVEVAPEDWERYASSGMPNFDEALLGVLDARVARLESEGFTYKGWATPGGQLAGGGAGLRPHGVPEDGEGRGEARRVRVLGGSAPELDGS